MKARLLVVELGNGLIPYVDGDLLRSRSDLTQNPWQPGRVSVRL
jgi:hypothetical protein